MRDTPIRDAFSRIAVSGRQQDVPKSRRPSLQRERVVLHAGVDVFDICCLGRYHGPLSENRLS